MGAIEYNKHKNKFVVFGDNNSNVCIADINLDLEIQKVENGYVPTTLPDFRFNKDRFLTIGSSESGGLIELVMIDTLANRNESFLFGEPDVWQQMADNRSIVNATNGQFYGYSFQWDGYLSYSPNPLNLHLVKFDSSMNIIFERFYEDKASHFAMDFATTRDGGCVMAAHIYDTNVSTEYYGLQILKVDSLGNYIPNTVEDIAATQQGIKVYPNPGFESFNISVPIPFSNAVLSLYNMAGTKVLSKKLSESLDIIITENLPNGIYSWEVIAEDFVLERGKWVKQ